jgi:hypothetical protein
MSRARLAGSIMAAAMVMVCSSDEKDGIDFLETE